MSKWRPTINTTAALSDTVVFKAAFGTVGLLCHHFYPVILYATMFFSSNVNTINIIPTLTFKYCRCRCSCTARQLSKNRAVRAQNCQTMILWAYFCESRAPIIIVFLLLQTMRRCARMYWLNDEQTAVGQGYCRFTAPEETAAGITSRSNVLGNVDISYTSA